MPSKIKTPNAGATRQRDDILALIRRHRKALEKGEDKKLFKGLDGLGFYGIAAVEKYLRHLDNWILESNDRQNAKKGGLGTR